MKNIQVSDRLKKFIERHIDLIENASQQRDLSILYRYVSDFLGDSDRIDLWHILKELDNGLADCNEWLLYSGIIPSKFLQGDDLPMLRIPPAVQGMHANSVDGCNIGKLVIEYSPRKLRINSSAISSCEIDSIISNRDLHLGLDAFDKLRGVERFEIYKDIWCDYGFDVTFPMLYQVNPNMMFVVSNDSMFGRREDKQPLSKHLSDLGFKNIKIV